MDKMIAARPGWDDVGGIPPRMLAQRCLERRAEGYDANAWIERHVHPALRGWVRDYVETALERAR